MPSLDTQARTAKGDRPTSAAANVSRPLKPGGASTTAATSCEHCQTSTTECAPGLTWPLYTGPCVACGRPSRTSAACGQPHCVDCRQPALEVDAETEQQVTARIYGNSELAVFPVWWVDNAGVCACPMGRLREDDQNYCGRRTDGAVNGSPGKHPLFAPAHRSPSDPLHGTGCKGECGKVGHGVHDATANVEILEKWWGRYPLANIGMPADANGFGIVDLDERKGGGRSFAELNTWALGKGVDLSATLAAYTGSDDGSMHFFFTAPEGGILSKSSAFGPDFPGLDTRGRGGYVVVAPSLHAAGGTYQWVDYLADAAPWPDFLSLLMNRPKAPVMQPAPVRFNVGGQRVGYGQTAMENELSELGAATEGGRNDRLHLAAFNLGQLVGGGALDEMLVRRELYRVGVAIGLTERECAGTIMSGMRAGATKPRTGG